VPPSIQSISNPPPTTDLGQATLTCVASGDPDPEVTWRSPGGQFVTETQGDYVLDGGELRVRAARNERDGGVWGCVACNVLGCDTATTRLQVEGRQLFKCFFFY
jgi:hypothetical protein